MRTLTPNDPSDVVRTLILAGDGVGGEIMPQVRRIVEWSMAARRLRIDLRERLFGLSAWKAHGTLMPDETWGEILATDAVLFGAIGSHEYPRHCLCFLAYMLDRRDDGCRNKRT
jgi:isocitrate/isopropylmalate dehydrogenase